MKCIIIMIIMLLTGCASVEKRCLSRIADLPASIDKNEAYQACVHDQYERRQQFQHNMAHAFDGAKIQPSSHPTNCFTQCFGNSCNTNCN